MPQVAIAAAATWAGAATATAIGLEAGTIAFGVASAAASLAVSYAGNALLNSAEGTGTTSGGALSTTIRQPAAARRLIYGEVKTGGILAYAGQRLDGDAHLIILLGEGEIDAVDPVFWIGDELSSDPKFDGLLHMEWFSGHPDQVACATLMAAIPEQWTSEHRLRGIAYAYVRMKFDRNAFPRGLIFPTFKVRGRKIYDPRTGATAWSENVPLATLDYLRSPYSVGCPDDLIDADSFIAAANIADEVIDSADAENLVEGVAGKLKRYTLNGVFETSSSPVPVIETQESACAGKLVFAQGKYRFYAGAYRPPVGTITAEFLRADPTFRTHVGRQQRVNIARGTYREPRQDWQDTDFAPQKLPAALIAEAGEMVESFAYPATTNGATAQRLAKLAMLRARAKTPLVLKCNWGALQWRLWDVLTVDLPEINEIGRTFCVVDYTFAHGGGIDLTLTPDEAAHYAWDAASDEVQVKNVPIPEFNNEPPPITGLVVSGVPIASNEGESRSAISARWDATADVFMDHYEIQIKSVLDADYSAAESRSLTTPTYVATGAIVVGEEYDTRVRVVRGDGTSGEWSEILATLVAGDLTPPAPPAALSVTGAGTIAVHWTTPGGRDFRRSNVYTNTTNSVIGAILLVSVTGLADTPTTISHTPGALRYYYVSAQDATGNESALVYAGVAS